MIICLRKLLVPEIVIGLKDFVTSVVVFLKKDTRYLLTLRNSLASTTNTFADVQGDSDETFFGKIILPQM